VGLLLVCQRHFTDHLTSFIETRQVSQLGPANRPEVLHFAVLRQKGVRGRNPGNPLGADSIAVHWPPESAGLLGKTCQAALPGSCKWLSREAAAEAAPRSTCQPSANPQVTTVLPYALNAAFDRKRLESLLAEFESGVKRAVDRSLPRKLRQELLGSTPPHITHSTVLQLAKWCNTNSPVYWDDMDVARKISVLLFGCVVDRNKVKCVSRMA